MRIAVLGTGKIGGGLGERFREAGHDVVMGSRDPTLGGLAGQVVIDTMNPYANHPGQVALPELYGTSGLERLQELLPAARLVKGWNHVYAHTIRTSPDFDGQVATVLLCGDDEAARGVVAGLTREIGFDPGAVPAVSYKSYCMTGAPGLP